MDATATDWGHSGLAFLTGAPDGPTDFSRAPVLAEARRVAEDIRRRTGVHLEAATVLAGRAALLGLQRRGRISAGGATRLLAAADGWSAIALPRPEDVDALPALLEVDDPPADPWDALTRWAATRPVEAVVERTHLLDIPAAGLGETPPSPPRVRRLGPPGPPREMRSLLVADLSSMWAGPLCGRILVDAGATVVKVESQSRPDGTRAGNIAFFDWMNAGKLSVTVDFDGDLNELRNLLSAADVIIEGSRPAGLGRRGLGPDDLPERAGRGWLRISGHRDHRPAFGDDAAVSGGLVGAAADGPVFCADAIADPLTGLEAARAVAESLTRGGGELIEVTMSAVAARYAALPPLASIVDHAAPPPLPAVPAAAAAALGAHNATVHRLLAERGLAPC